MKTPALSACHRTETLLPAYAEHCLPAAEAASVAAHLATCPSCQLQLSQLRDLADDLAAALPEVPRTALRTNFMAMLEQQKALLTPTVPVAAPPEARGGAFWPPALANSWLRIAASIVLLAAGVWLGRQLPWAHRAPLATTAGQPESVQLRQALAGRAASASDRIQLVANSGQQSAPGDPTVQVLLNTLNFDPSPNVRLAACEALYRLRHDPRVREGLVHSLAIQTDPNVQITLIDMVVSLRVRRAVPQLERLAKRADALPVVRAQAEAGIGRLI